MSSSAQLLFCTCGDDNEAANLARYLVENKLAACVNIVPKIRSIYEWQGQLQDDAEVLLLIKTSSHQLPQLKQAVATQHSYDSPELISVNIEDGLTDYLAWIGVQTRG